MGTGAFVKLFPEINTFSLDRSLCSIRHPGGSRRSGGGLATALKHSDLLILVCEEIATVTTDACGGFCVFLPYWDSVTY